MPTTGPDRSCFARGAAWDGRSIRTARLTLRTFSETDAPALVALAGDWEVARNTAFIPHPYAESDARAFLAQAAERAAAGAAVTMAIEGRAEAALIGAIDARFADGAAEVAYWIGRPFWGRGFATEALRNALPVFFSAFDAASLTAAVLAGNAASMRVLEKAGFARMGAGVGGCCQGRCAGQSTVRFELSRGDWQARWAARPRILVAAVALVDADGRVLLARRPAGKSMAGLWEFPGGKVHDGETPEAALVRELHEELGIDTSGSCLAPLAFASHAYADFHLLMPLYVCHVWKGTPVPREGQALKWVLPHDLRAYPMPPADEPLVAMLRDWL